MNRQSEQIEQQRQTWNRYSGGWKKWNDFLMNLMRPVSGKMIEPLNLKGNEYILDVASGTGEPGLTAAALLPSGTVTAIDLSEKMVAIANEHAQQRGINNYQSMAGDVSAMPFKDNFFNAVICRFGMMFFPDIKASLKEIARVLKPGGRLAVAVWAAPEHNPFLTILGTTVMEKLALPKPPADEPGVFRFAKPGVAKELINDAGFINVNELNVDREIIYDSVEHYWEVSSDVAGPVMEALKKQPPEVIEHIKQAIFDKAKNFIKDDHKMHVNAQAIIIYAVKE